MTPPELLECIAAGESQTLEFKSSFDKASIESLVAFANTQGGTVLVTVTFAQRVKVSGGVTPESLLRLIKSQPGLKTTELANRIGKPRRTLERLLKQLKDGQQIEFRGPPKTGGYFPRIR